ncbi:MAG: SDR family oxidoreductase [Desulfobulbaceae bacterium]|nr:SDR family oxidoreductase [Desulfobulbaceae bacterium]
MTDFENQTVLISGATRGIGRAVAESFLQAGAYVIGLYAGDETSAAVFTEENSKFAALFELHKCDVSREADVASLFSHIEKVHGSLDVLINNAGIRKDAVLALMDSKDWQKVIDINLTGSFLMSKQAVLLMMQNKYGRIINITSPVAHLGFTGQANYAASKAGQVAMTKSLAKEVARKKITVNCVSPGFIATDFIKDLSKEQLSAYKKLVPMRRFGTTEEVAESVLFLAGKKASYITGTVLEITGGL